MKRIFVVEDEAIVALELQDQLRRLGYAICGHAARAEAALRDVPAARPDLVLMDINLGPGMNGIEAAERLRVDLDVPIVFVTAYSDAELARLAARSEASAYVVKPFLPDALRANIEMALLRHDSERRLREAVQAAHASQQLYEGLIAASPVGVFRSDPAGRIVYINPTACTITGLTPWQASSEGWTSALHPDDRAVVLAERQRTRALGIPFRMEYRFVAEAGRVVWVLSQIVPLRDAAGALIGHIGTVTDITPRRAAEDALRASEERYRRLFEEAIEGIFRSHADGRLLAVNPACARMLGHDSPDALIGTDATRLYVDPEDRRRLWALRCAQRSVEGFETRFVKKNGERITVEIFARTVPDGAGDTVQGMIRDVTEQVQHRTALEVLSTGLAVLTGAAFFNEVAAQLAAIVDAEIGFVATLLPGQPLRQRTLGFTIDGKEVPAIEKAIAGTPCESITERKAIAHPDDVQRRFPGDAFLREQGARSYVAWPLTDATGRLLGSIGVLARRPLSHPERVVSIARLFGLRVAAELERNAPPPADPPAVTPAPDAAAPTIAGLTLRFNVSRDEEYIELRALHAGGTIELRARAHHYLLLQLARLRLESSALPPDEQGWIHQELLLRQLRTDTSRLYLDIYRIRRQLADAGVADAANIVERRPGTRQLRLGLSRIEIIGLPTPD